MYQLIGNEDKGWSSVFDRWLQIKDLHLVWDYRLGQQRLVDENTYLYDDPHFQ